MAEAPRDSDLGPTPSSVSAILSEVDADRLERYAVLLAEDGVVRGLIGPREIPRMWERHLLNCWGVADRVPQNASVCDVGSGAGLPGLVLAITRPDLHVTLVEPLLRRTSFLNDVVGQLGLTNVEVIRGRADLLHGTRSFDIVTSRAVAPLERLLGWSMPLVAPDGSLVAMKGSSAAEEIEASRSTWSAMGCARPEIHRVGTQFGDAQALVVQVVWNDSTRGAPVSGSASDRPSDQRR